MGDLEYRADPDRAIHIVGEVNSDLIDSLVPRIVKFQAENSRPITVFIDSYGGFVGEAERLMRLLASPSQAGTTCAMLTFAAGRAQSAAAILLAHGNYAIASRTAQIHFHGLRQQTRAHLTTELAAEISSALQNENDASALKLANACIGRFVWLFGTIRSSLKVEVDSPVWVDEFAKTLQAKLSQQNQQIVGDALKRGRETAQLSDFVFTKFRPGKNAPFKKVQALVLKRILDYEVAQQPEDWTFSGDNLTRLRTDFFQLIDYIAGDHHRHIRAIEEIYSSFFLTPSESKKLEQFSPSESTERDKWLESVIRPRMVRLWYFVVSLCRLLYRGENPLQAVEAYWLGLVDEVAGTDLPNLRLMIEESEKASPAPETTPALAIPAPE
jgi:ATP-dependent protease ClpP protease subunit